MGNNFVSNSNAISLISKIAQRLGLRPKTWTGTKNDWDNLDPSVQAEYEYVNFTDDYSPTQIITWDDWNAMTPEQQAAIPEAEIINAPGVDGSLKANILKLLWTNPSPTSDFANQNITASLSDSILNYKFFVLTYKKASNENVLKTMIVPLGSSNLEWEDASTSSVDVIKRGVVFSAVNGSVVINGAVVYSSVSQAVVNNSKIIPVTIYGIKDSIELKFDAIASSVSTAADKCMMSNNTSVESNVNSLKTRVSSLEGRSNVKMGSMNINVNTAVSDYGPYTYAGSNGTTGKNIYALGAIAPAGNWLVLAEMYPSEDPDIQMIRVYANGTGTITVRYVYTDKT